MLIVWDYFGVIAQDSFWYTAERLADGNGKSEDIKRAQELADLGKLSWNGFTEEVSRDIGVPIDEVRDRYQHHDIKQQNILAIKHFDAHEHVLLSNASAEYLRPIMARLGLDRLFAEIFVSSEIGYAKPNPQAFLHVLQARGYSPQSSVMIDDSARNVDSAMAIGMNGLIFHSGTDIQKELAELL